MQNEHSATFEELTEAAELGDHEAQHELGRRYQEGHGIAQDYAKAVLYYERALPLKNAATYCNLGILHQQGWGTPLNFERAFELYSIAAEMDYAPALFNLSVLYNRGQGTRKDTERALSLLRRAAALGHEEAIQVVNRFGL